jgi:hypothetical protein
MHHLLVLQQGETILTHNLYVPKTEDQPTFQEILSIRRDQYKDYVLIDWYVK